MNVPTALSCAADLLVQGLTAIAERWRLQVVARDIRRRSVATS